MRRRFNKSERITLYLSADGRCQACGARLGGGWHGDHKTPYAAGGPTEVENGQALCPSCNQTKGVRMTGNLVRRRWQEDWLSAARMKVELGEKFLVGNIFCGSGKTFGTNDVTNELYRRGIVDAVVVLVPRINLCRQYELDWSEAKWLYSEPMGEIVHRQNDAPLFRVGRSNHENFGYVTTYDSVVSRLDLHLRELQGKRFALVLDEAQRLGARVADDDGTKAATAVLSLAERATFVQLVTGTPYRADGQPLVLARYSAPDSEGRRTLNADVRATYLEGVREGYLRPFEALLKDGKGVQEYLSGGTEYLRLAEMERGFCKIVEAPEFWKPLVDETIALVKAAQAVDIRDPKEPGFQRLCGLIGACRQSHARQIIAYLQEKRVSAILAVSEQANAAKELERFKDGNTDILVTVAMAHVGYDHKPITVVCCLNHYRQRSWLDQFAARGLRMMRGIPRTDQTLRYIGPDDILHRVWADEMRRNSDMGMLERDMRGVAEERDQERATPEAFVMRDVEVLGGRAIGMDEQYDLDYLGFAHIDELAKRFNISAAPHTGLAALLISQGAEIPTGDPYRAQPPLPIESRPKMTEQDWESTVSSRLNDLCIACDSKLKKKLGEDRWQFGETGSQACKYFRVTNWKNQGVQFMLKVEAYIKNTFIPERLGADGDDLRS